MKQYKMEMTKHQLLVTVVVMVFGQQLLLEQVGIYCSSEIRSSFFELFEAVLAIPKELVT